MTGHFTRPFYKSTILGGYRNEFYCIFIKNDLCLYIHKFSIYETKVHKKSNVPYNFIQIPVGTA